MPVRAGRVILCALVLAQLLGVAGCAVRYLDPRTGIEHLWGIGHLTVKVTKPSENTRAIMTGASTVGLAVGSTAAERYVAFGVARQERAEVVEDTELCVVWPKFGALGIRVGTRWKPTEATDTCEQQTALQDVQTLFGNTTPEKRTKIVNKARALGLVQAGTTEASFSPDLNGAVDGNDAERTRDLEILREFARDPQ